jgi:hypothetical protein
MNNDTITINKNDLIFWIAVFILQVLFIAWWKGMLTTENLPIPFPVPSTNITVASQAEYNVVIDALDQVANEWAMSQYDSVQDAKQGLHSMMGGTTGGVNQAAFTRILAAFQEECDFLGVVEELKRKIVINGREQ